MQKNQYWAIIPAAGIGQRMQADKPKQYLPLYEKTVIELTLDRLLSLNEIVGVVLSISDTDEYWNELNYQSEKTILVAKGGQERSDSVLNALNLLMSELHYTESTWVLVHDAARPCVRLQDIKNLINVANQSDDGGLLAFPVKDTMKRAQTDNPNKIAETVIRDGLWHALTPQMFRLDCLTQALNKAIELNAKITDDASAMEIAGYSPVLVEGHEDNIKITRAFDLQLAELFLQKQSDNNI